MPTGIGSCACAPEGTSRRPGGPTSREGPRAHRSRGSFWGYSHDDAFITYRYADQWARGNGLTFNTGEHVLGTSAPGYTLLLGFLSRATGFLGIGVPEWGTMLSLAAILVLSWVLAPGSRARLCPFGWVSLLFGVGALLLFF